MAQFMEIIYPQEFGYPGMHILSTCQDELREIVETSNVRAKLRSDYESRLKVLNQHRSLAQNVMSKWFEHLKNDGPYYAMRFKGSDNFRVLYTFRGNDVYFLCAFRERKKDDYKHYIKIAKNRAKLI